jgi:hypothetical protein
MSPIPLIPINLISVNNHENTRKTGFIKLNFDKILFLVEQTLDGLLLDSRFF